MKDLTLRIVFKKIKLFFHQLLDFNLTKLYRIFPQIASILGSIIIYMIVLSILDEAFYDIFDSHIIYNSECPIGCPSNYNYQIVLVSSGILLLVPLVYVLRKSWTILILKIKNWKSL